MWWKTCWRRHLNLSQAEAICLPSQGLPKEPGNFIVPFNPMKFLTALPFALVVLSNTLSAEDFPRLKNPVIFQRAEIDRSGKPIIYGKLWVMEADGSHLRQLTWGTTYDEHPSLYSDLEHVLFGEFLANGYLPVLTPPGSSDIGEAINVDGDRAAASLAAAVNAEALVILSKVLPLWKSCLRVSEVNLVRRILKLPNSGSSVLVRLQMLVTSEFQENLDPEDVEVMTSMCSMSWN